MRLLASLLAAALLPAGVAQAQVDDDGLVVATCTTGQGCHCYLSNQSRGALATMLETDPPDGVAHPVFVIADGDMAWSAITRQELDFTYGGDGLCDPEPFSPAEAGLPLNGTWTLTVTGHELSGCPAQVGAAIAGEVVVGQTSSRHITWPRPFSPAPLMADAPVALDWVNNGGGRWSTRVVDEGSESGAFGRVTMQARILGPREIATTSVFSTNVLAVMNGATCVSTTHATLRHGG